MKRNLVAGGFVFLLIAASESHAQLYVNISWSSTTPKSIGASSSSEYRNYWFAVDYNWWITLDAKIDGPRTHANYRSGHGTVSVSTGLYENMPGWSLPDGCYVASASALAQKGSDTQSQGAATSQYCFSDPNPPPLAPEDKCDGLSGLGQPCSPIIVNLIDGPWKLSGPDDPVFFDIDADGEANRITWTGRGELLV